MPVAITFTPAFYQRRMMEQVAYLAQLSEQWAAAQFDDRPRIATLAASAKAVFYRMENELNKATAGTYIIPEKPLYNLTFSNPKY